MDYFVVHWWSAFDMVDWSYRSNYINKHGVSSEEADEAISDPARVTLHA